MYTQPCFYTVFFKVTKCFRYFYISHPSRPNDATKNGKEMVNGMYKTNVLEPVTDQMMTQHLKIHRWI